MNGRNETKMLKKTSIFTFLLIYFILPTKAYASERAVTYIGNYEVTESEDIKKEVVRVAGGMGKVVKSREKNIKTRDIPQWEYKYITTDSQGSTRQELTENNIQTNTIPKPNTYYAYGSVIQSASVGSRVLNAQTQVVEDTYTGQIKDEETGLMYYNARYYNPQTGLFIQADSVDDGQNKYQYVGGNPVNMTDPSGNWCIFGFGNTCNMAKVNINNSDIELAKSHMTNSNGPLIDEDIEAVARAFKYYPSELTKTIKINHFYGGDYSNAFVSRKDSNTIHLNMKMGFFQDLINDDWTELPKEDKTLTLVHEIVHIWQRKNQGDFDEADGNNYYFENFNNYIKIIENSGIVLNDDSDGFRIVGDERGGTTVPTSTNSLSLPKGFNNFIRKYGKSNIMELGATLGESYIDNKKAIQFRELWPEMYNFYKEEIFGGKEFINVEE